MANSKVVKSGKMTPVRGGKSGQVGKQGGTATAKPGVVSIPGHAKGGGKFAKGGPSGQVGKQGVSSRAQPGVVSVAKRGR